MKTKMNEKGSVLIAATIVTMLVLAAVVQYCVWVSRNASGTVHRVAAQKALVNADSGLQAALQFLRSPKASSLPPGGTPMSLTTVAEGTTFYVQMVRQVTDASLVDIYSTGYYYIPQGSFADSNGNKAQMGAIYARVQLRNVGDFFAATPGTLQISYGSNISSGVIYGRDLVFETGSTSPQTILKGASYLNSIAPGNFASYVTFLDPGQPKMLPNAPTLPTLDVSLRNQYASLAGNTDILLPNTVLAGPVGAPTNSYKVYFSSGDVYLGNTSLACLVTQSFLIYSQGDIYIANSVDIQLGGTNWPALMAEGNIYITATAPDDLHISATMVTNGKLKALGASRPNGRLHLTGGITSGGGIELGNIYTLQREYIFQGPDPSLPLPFATQLIQYNITHGKQN